MLSPSNLHDYQLRAVEFIKANKRVGLFLDMGLGKTISTLTALADLHDGFSVNKTLIIAPLRVANSVWAQEAANWSHLQHLNVSICTGSEKQRMAALHSDSEVFVINRENVKWLVDHYSKRWPFDCVVVDEASSFKSASSARFKALKKVLPMTTHMVLLTGTPSPNGLLDLWAQVYLIDFGMSLGRTMSAYKQRFFESDYMGYKFSPRDGSDKIIHDLIRPMVLSMSAEDYLSLPDRIDLTARVDMPPKVLADYLEFERTMFAEFDDGQEVEAINAAVLAGKLMQYANGALYTDEHKNWSLLHDAKLDALAEIVESNPDEPLLVAYNFKSDLARLMAKFPDAVALDKDPQTIERWNDGKIPMLLAHPACLHPSTEVLTEYRGWVKIIEVENCERVFDGIEFVSHKGCSFSGVRQVISTFGITLTRNHKLLIGNDWVEAKDVRDSQNVRSQARYTYAGNDPYLGEMLPLWADERNSLSKCDAKQPTKSQTLPPMYRAIFPQHDKHSLLEYLAAYEGSGNKQDQRRLQKVWRKRYWYIGRMDDLSKLLSRYVRDLSGWANDRSNRQLERLLQRKLPMGYKHATTGKQAEQPQDLLQRQQYAPCRVLQDHWSVERRNKPKVKQWDDSGRGDSRLQSIEIQKGASVKSSEVYDLVDCGPRSRFLIRNENGEVFISHNSAGHGLNLQRGGCVAVWFGLSWSLELYQQFCARLHRQGQGKPVRVMHIVTNGTIDDRVMAVLAAKDAVQSKLLSALKPLVA